jgi:hypothetical protein
MRMWEPNAHLGQPAFALACVGPPRIDSVSIRAALLRRCFGLASGVLVFFVISLAFKVFAQGSAMRAKGQTGWYATNSHKSVMTD